MRPKVYTYHEHQIPIERIDPDAVFVIHKLKQAGYSAYLVGGGVRDLLMKTQPKDFDVSTSAKPEEIRRLFRNAILIGRRFRLAHIRFEKKIIEVSTFRAGDAETADLILRDNLWGSEEEDVLRRDFTINGLFYDPENQKVIDYVGGFQDVERRILRAIGQPEVRFIQDPVRMIRLIKFCARFDFAIHRSTHEALLTCKEHIIKSSSARILEELLRMLESGAAEPFFRLLHQYGLLKFLIPSLSHFIDLDQEERVFKMLQEVDAEIKKIWPNSLDRALPLSALCYPIFELTIRHLATHSQQPLHLGQISKEAYHLIVNLFAPFLRLPNRIQGAMAFILSTQFRFTPLDPRPTHRLRIPRDELVPLALQLFQMRCARDHELYPLYTRWSEASFSQPVSPARRRRRRKKS